VLFGNARLGMVPAMHWAQWMNLGERYVLFAHRDPGGNFLDSVATLRFDVVANSEWVAAWYRGQTPGRVSVCYGLASAERFYPPAADAGPAGARGDGRLHMVLLGRLPNISKGQERALAALRELPESVRARVHLHLASFAQPPELTDPCVTAHPWMPPDRVGEFLRGMDAMLAISTHETFSQAIVQGMLTGLPIIASDLPVYVEKLDTLSGAGSARDDGAGQPEVRRGGLLCRSNAEIGAAIEMLAGDAALRARLGAEGRAIALARYVWDTDHFVREHLFAG
jgi:glycosyltransferase involved in cell wall biosynthesis